MARALRQPRRATLPPLVLVRDGMVPGPYSDTAATPRAPEVDPHDVLAQLEAQPVPTPVITGTPVDTVAADRIGRRTVVTFEGESESNKTGLLLAACATRLRAGDHVVLHVADRDAFPPARRLARMLGVEPDKLRTTFPRLRVRDGDLVECIALVSPGSTFALDSVQAARNAVRCRPEAADHERVNEVLRVLRQVAKDGALVLGTIETKAGQPRFSASTAFDADVRIKCDANGSGFSVEAAKPRRSGKLRYTVDARGWPVVAGNELDIPSFVAHQHTASRKKKRRPDNPPARTADELRADILAHVGTNPGCLSRHLYEHVRGRDQNITRSLHELLGSGILERRDGGLHVVG